MHLTSPVGLGLGAPEDRAPDARTEFPLCPVATHKFIALSLCTLGLYQLYWLYSNWCRIRDASGEILSPFWRAVLAPVWSYSLLDRIRTSAEEEGLRVRWMPAVLGTLFVLLTLASRLPDPWFLISVGSFLALLPAQLTAQRVNDRYQAVVTERRNDDYSLGNVAVMLLGWILWVLVILGSLLPEDAPAQEW